MHRQLREEMLNNGPLQEFDLASRLGDQTLLALASLGNPKGFVPSGRGKSDAPKGRLREPRFLDEDWEIRVDFLRRGAVQVL
jgi:hypothetical protein